MRSADNFLTKEVIITLVLGAVLGATLVCCTKKYYDNSKHVCLKCGLVKIVESEAFGWIPYKQKKHTKDTSISRAMKATNCVHSWFLVKFGRGSGYILRGWKTHIDGSAPSIMIPFALNDDALAADLSKMSNPSMVWSNVVKKLSTNQELDEAMLSWWAKAEGRSSFSNWYSRRF